MKTGWAANLVLLIAAAGAIWLLWPTARPMPSLTFNLTDGGQLKPDDLRGTSLLLTFWSVSCAVCLHDMPRLSRLHDSLEDQGFTVLGVAVPNDPPTAVIDVVRKLAPTYPIALDVHGEVSRAFGNVRVTPTSFLIDPDGNISYSEHGPLDEARVRATLLTFRR